MSSCSPKNTWVLLECTQAFMPNVHMPSSSPKNTQVFMPNVHMPSSSPKNTWVLLECTQVFMPKRAIAMPTVPCNTFSSYIYLIENSRTIKMLKFGLYSLLNNICLNNTWLLLECTQVFMPNVHMPSSSPKNTLVLLECTQYICRTYIYARVAQRISRYCSSVPKYLCRTCICLRIARRIPGYYSSVPKCLCRTCICLRVVRSISIYAERAYASSSPKNTSSVPKYLC